MTTETNPSRPTSRLSPGLRTAARGSQVVVERDLPVLFQMPAVKGAKGGAATANVLSRPAHPEKVSTTDEPAKVELPKNSPPPTRPVSQVARREPPAATRKWFDGQGKLITICFLIALTATIYFARSRTNPGANRSNDQWQKTNPGDAAGEVAKSQGMGPPAIVIPKPATPALAASPAAPLPPNVSAEPPLAPDPSVTPLPAEMVAETPPADVKLLTPKEPPAGRSSFPADVANAPNNVADEGPPVAPEMAAESEPRVATAPGRSSWQPNDAGPVPSVPPANYGPNNSYPPRNDGYPLNSTPNVGNRTAPPAAGLYPTTDPARFRYYTPSSGTAAPGNALPGNQPRYERTGSGLY